MGEIGGKIDEDFFLLTVARQLGIPWNAILDVPETIAEAAWQNYLAERNAR